MKELLIFSGTTEGRTLSKYLETAQVRHTVCVATEYGELVLQEHPLVTVRQGRMNQEEIEAFLDEKKFAAVVDATHPFAKEVTNNIKLAVDRQNALGNPVRYLRLKRDCAAQRESGQNIQYFQTNASCVKALEKTQGNILLTTGSKELPEYCVSENLKRRLYVRVLPSLESISLCLKQGICGKQILAMQGPFTAEMNEAVIHQYHISHMVTKESGISGGYPDKLEAAERTGAQVYVIGCPEETGGYSFSEMCEELEKYIERKKCTEIRKHIVPAEKQERNMEIVLAGIGMGHKNCMTKEVENAINEADILLGAERILENLHPKFEKRPLYQAKQIIPYLEEMQRKNLSGVQKKAAVLFSGDSGFYSGCQPLYAALKKEINGGRLKASLRIMPGISSVACLAACIGENYQDAAVYSMHGKKLNNLIRRIQNSQKTFLLTSGVTDINRLGKLLLAAGLTNCEVTVGYRLSYEDQKIEKLTPSKCCELTENGLYTCFINNPDAVKRNLTHGIADEAFIRDKVPMTKEEVREVSICKLRLQEGAVVYDIGSGTGSVAVEIAGLSDSIQVYALEQKKEAVELIEKNKQKFCLENITVVETMAPDGLLDLPMATHAFIGGSKGRLKEILAELQRINPAMRVVINAISLETISEVREILSLFPVEREEIVQLQVARAKKAGAYHLMQSENPVWICAFNFAEFAEEKQSGGLE